ncbi:MAG: aminotransferase class I/II-fold pyridoxal phosphate-dependent enzyme, partial [Caldilineaceae bacterium]
MSPIQLSPALQHKLEPSPTLRINELVNQMWAQGHEVYHLGFGESRFPVHPKIQQALADNAHQKSYLAGQGLEALREQIARFYTNHLGMNVAARQIMVGPGSKALIYALQMALDAALILPTPSWVSYAPQAELLGRPVIQMHATPADQYEFTLAALDEAAAQSPKAQKILIINSPNNPTGQMLRPELLQELAAYCREKQILVLSDEIYALTPHGHAPHVSLASYYPEGTVVLGGLSKHMSLGGWRLGVAVLPDTADGALLVRAARVVAGEIWSTPSAPVQYAAITAYSDDAELASYVRECAAIHAIRTQHLWSWLVELGIPCAQPDGAFYMFPNFDHLRQPLAAAGVQTSDDLARYLLAEHRIATLPGTAFGAPAHDLSLRLA